MNCISKLTALVVGVMLALGIATTASAQVFTGRIDVTVVDQTGGRLPGVTVDLTGPVNQTAVTDEQGQAHFLNLSVGNYTVKANLAGFSPYSNNQIQVNAGQAVPIDVKMGVAGTAETVNVTSAAPIIDTKRETSTTAVTLEELQNIPSARDPWVVLQTVPSIYVDRVNVGGSESGQQSNYLGKGAAPDQNTWYMDGVPITDMGATGSSPTYFNFDMFQEMAVTTGGADAAIATPGVQMNMVLKKGTNTFHGDASTYWEGQSLQSSNLPASLAATPGVAGNKTDEYLDSAFDVGGPIIKDRLWAWGTFGRTDVNNIVLNGAHDQTFLYNPSIKVDGQINNNIRANFTWFEGNKDKFGRSAGPTRPAETAWNQTGPTNMWKEEGNFVIGQSLFLSARYAYISGGFSLLPEAGTAANAYQDDAGVWHGSYLSFATNRPQYYGGGDGSYFVKNHEVKFGFTYRKTPVTSSSVWPGNHLVTFYTGYPSVQVQATQPYYAAETGRYEAAYATDTITFNRLTLIAGLRWDRETSSLDQTTEPALPGFALLPAKTIPAMNNAFDFNTITPRIGATYALNESRKTVVRGDYAIFVAQLPATQAGFISPGQYAYATYNGTLQPGQTSATAANVNFAGGTVATSGFNPANPGALSTPNTIASNLSVPRTQEADIALDHELMPNFSITAEYTYRYMNDFLWSPPVGATGADYSQTGTFSGSFQNVGSVNVPYYGLNPAVAAAGNFGYSFQNRPDYHQRYQSFDVEATKRMSNHWMARIGFSTTSWQEFFDSSAAILDPTRTAYPSGQFAYGTKLSGPLVNGGQVVVQSAGSGKSGIYMVAPQYQITANGMYQAPWGIDLGANMVVVQGYSEPWYRSRVNTGDPEVGLKSLLLAPSATSSRLPTTTELDARIEKRLSVGKTNFSLMFDVFNILNQATVLGIQYDARVTNYNQTLEIQNPRIARLGIRFFF